MLKSLVVVTLTTLVVGIVWGVLASTLGIPARIVFLAGTILGTLTAFATLIYMED